MVMRVVLMRVVLVMLVLLQRLLQACPSSSLDSKACCQVDRTFVLGKENRVGDF